MATQICHPAVAELMVTVQTVPLLGRIQYYKAFLRLYTCKHSYHFFCSPEQDRIERVTYALPFRGNFERSCVFFWEAHTIRLFEQVPYIPYHPAIN